MVDTLNLAYRMPQTWKVVQSGEAEVHIAPPGGMERTLNFSGNQVTAPGSQSVKSTRQGYEWAVEVNDFERYRIPDAVVNGG